MALPEEVEFEVEDLTYGIEVLSVWPEKHGLGHLEPCSDGEVELSGVAFILGGVDGRVRTQVDLSAVVRHLAQWNGTDVVTAEKDLYDYCYEKTAKRLMDEEMDARLQGYEMRHGL